MNVINSNSVMAMRAAILQQNSALREAASAASAPASPVSGASAPASTDFGAAMKSALSEVNALQGQSSEATAAYQRGETTDIAPVMLANQQNGRQSRRERVGKCVTITVVDGLLKKNTNQYRDQYI